MQKLLVEKKDDGKKLVTFITTNYPNVKIGTIRKALRKKDIKINGKRVSSDCVINKNDTIELYISDELLFNIKKVSDITIVYEDENIIVFNKPEELEVEGENSLSEIMKDKYEFLKPCHRIDRNTSGLVLFAKNQDSLNELENAFKNSKIEKLYMACCYKIPKKYKTMEAFLFKDRKKSIVYISNKPKKGYVKIVTSYKVIASNLEKNISLLKVTLHTGRTHQIRAHLAYEGYPIIGDGKYGSYEINKKFKAGKQKLCSCSMTFHNLEGNLKYLNEKTIKLKDEDNTVIKFYQYIC